MKKEDLLTQIAETGYNAGYGAKLCFASYDMLRLAPGVLGFVLTCIGVLGLVVEALSTKFVSALSLCAGLLTFYLNPNEKRLVAFIKSGEALTKVRDDLGALHAKVSATNGLDFNAAIAELQGHRETYYKNRYPEQLLFASWLAHFKFFGEAKVKWIEDQLKLTFFKDKVPATAKAWGATIILLIFGWLIFEFGTWMRYKRIEPTVKVGEATVYLDVATGKPTRVVLPYAEPQKPSTQPVKGGQ